MAFIRKRISPAGRRTPSYQVIETYREGGHGRDRAYKLNGVRSRRSGQIARTKT